MDVGAIFFKTKNEPKSPKSHVSHCIDDVLIGAVMGFKFKHGKTQEEKQYVFDNLVINEINASKSHLKDNCVQAQADWYTFDSSGSLARCGVFYLDVGNYLATTIAPTVTECKNSNTKKMFLYGDFSVTRNYLLSILNP